MGFLSLYQTNRGWSITEVSELGGGDPVQGEVPACLDTPNEIPILYTHACNVDGDSV